MSKKSGRSIKVVKLSDTPSFCEMSGYPKLGTSVKVCQLTSFSTFEIRMTVFQLLR